MTDTDRWLTIWETAEAVNRPVATLRDWRKKGRGPKGFIAEGRLMYAESEIARWKSEQAAKAVG
jgi:predicted site-specific integrase-resolvase